MSVAVMGAKVVEVRAEQSNEHEGRGADGDVAGGMPKMLSFTSLCVWLWLKVSGDVGW